MKKGQPDYRKIYSDMISKKYPEKADACQETLNKETLSAMDIICLHNLLFKERDKESFNFNQKLKSYDYETIRGILDYQRKHNLNNTQLAKRFKLSRNTVARWKLDNFFNFAKKN